MPVKNIDTVRALESARYAAMIEGDVEQLDAMLYDDLHYVHSNGKRETKEQFLGALSAGRRRYRDIEVQTQELREFGDTVVVTGKLRIELESATGPLSSSMTYIAVHVLQKNQWRLISWQATRTASE
ncbi:nuclear transport factor 2 family protein [Pandoraea sp.]|uniref:nuclear transport factor 2 family protein n=1 Tax=Pandoraea sp. TaxID=1883445 RepID=UPI00120ABCF5|nr:nuclear transport factor 2 family protein [Pandoraea sp.]MDE2611621.1 nuclear transport factor 2 family protein [Burkholderiales bacterium]TAL54168.1 MAG: nuclear transport factor 2 family protein [Pandoraea sp.]TAM15811.1 MAG: nuclear transport factor 2 family protein [Pandoraea sp.]